MTAQERFFNDFADMVRPEVKSALDTAILTLLEFFGDLESVKTHAGESINYKHNIGDNVVVYMVDNTIEVHDKLHGEWFALELSTSAKKRRTITMVDFARECLFGSADFTK